MSLRSGTERKRVAGTASDRADKPSTVAIEGNGSIQSHRGDGYSESDVMYTMNAVEHHAVATDLYNQSVTGGVSATLSAYSCMTPTRNGPSVLSFQGSAGAQASLQIGNDISSTLAVAKECMVLTHGDDR